MDVFTGSFGNRDIFHTLIDAATGLQERADAAYGAPKGILKALSRLVDRLFDGDETHQAEDLEQHQRWIMTGRYTSLVEQGILTGEVHPNSVAALRRMNEIDVALARRYPMVRRTDGNRAPLGVVGFVQKVASLARREQDASDNASAGLDRVGVTTDDRMNNGASGEIIGSHSLLAKDSPRANPLRNETVRLATYVAVYIAKRMSERIATHASGRLVVLDWLHLLQHFLSHPAETEGRDHGWWEAALSDEGAETAHVPRYIDEDEATRRSKKAQALRRELESRYNMLAAEAEREWKLLKSVPGIPGDR